MRAQRGDPPRGLLGGMLAFPTSGWDGTDLPPPVAADWREAGTARHVFTHFALTLTVLTGEAEGAPVRGAFRPAPTPAELPGLMRKVLAAAMSAP